MPKIVSFAWTAPALLAGHKTVTRRDWARDYAERFQPLELVTAYDRSPRLHGTPIARIRILSVTYELDRDTPDSDYEAEGFLWLAAHPECLPKQDRDQRLLNVSRERFERWRRGDGASWVVRFAVEELLVRPDK